MSENENIEAKLCSYVEGDLDAAGRGEIEKYLLANPQYRPLIAELSKTRGLLRGLPREAAPAELLETLSGQIERSSLLGDVDQDPVRMHSNRLPHLAAWAAVLLLTGGLAAVIYRVLPSNKTQSELALLKPAPQAASSTQMAVDELQKAKFEQQDQTQVVQSPAAIAEAAPPALASPAAPGSLAATTAPVVGSETSKALTLSTPVVPAAAMPATASAVASADSSFAGTVMAGGRMMSNAASPEQQATQAVVSGEATQLGQNMYVTLRAADEKAADARVTQYLDANGIQYESHPLDAGVNSAARVSAGPLQPLAFTPANVNATARTDSAAAQAPSSAVVNSPVYGMANRGMVQGMRHPADKEMAASQAAWGQPLGGSVIVARNLTTEQARRLTNDLAVNVLPGPLSPAVAPVAMDEAPHVGGGGGGGASGAALQAGERVRIVAKENGLPGVEAMDEQQTIDADGNLTLPLVGKMSAAGLTEAELELKIPLAYRDAKSPTTETWMIQRVPTTEPVIDTKLALTPSVANGVTATTQPAVAAAGQQGIDVTIRVVAQGAAGPTTEPAVNVMAPGASTQPAAAAAPIAAPVTTMPTTAP